jgi:hypothetical protein
MASGLTLALPAVPAQGAGCGCSACTSWCEPAYELVERTIYVPTMVSERRSVQVTECRLETRQRTVTIHRSVPETKQVNETYVVMVPEVRSRTETYVVQKPVWREVDRTVTVRVPHPEQRQGVRQVCRQVQVEEMRTVCRDQGQWEEVACDGGCAPAYGCCGICRRRLFACGTCGGCGAGNGCGYDAGCGGAVAAHTHRVWRPNIVTEQVPVKVWRSQIVDEPYEYTTTVYRPEQRTERIKVCDYVPEEQTRDVRYTVCMPKQMTRVRNVTTYRVVSEPRVESYTVKVPYPVTKEVNVMVCKMVPKTVTCRVPISVPCGGCGGRGCCGW